MNLDKATAKNLNKEYLNKQAQHWENIFSNRSEMFGDSPSIAATKAAETFKEAGLTNILELGSRRVATCRGGTRARICTCTCTNQQCTNSPSFCAVRNPVMRQGTYGSSPARG